MTGWGASVRGSWTQFVVGVRFAIASCGACCGAVRLAPGLALEAGTPVGGQELRQLSETLRLERAEPRRKKNSRVEADAVGVTGCYP
jgi:hypothetical protein